MSNNYNYTPILAETADGTGAQEICALYDSKVPQIMEDQAMLFGSIGEPSPQCGLYFIDCKCPKTMAERIVIEPRMAELLIPAKWADGRPSFLPEDKNDFTELEASLIEGAIGWSAPSEA